MEKIFVILLGILAIFILIRNFKKKASGGGCDCSSCSSHCGMFSEKDKENQEHKDHKDRN